MTLNNHMTYITQCYGKKDKTAYVYMRLMYIGVIHWNPSHELGTRWRVVEVMEAVAGRGSLGMRFTFSQRNFKTSALFVTDNRSFEWGSLIKVVHRSNLIAVNRGFGGRYCIHSEGRRVSQSSLLDLHFNLEDGYSILLRND
jgi:hypothetical protein